MSLDILLEMREHIRKGEPPGNSANAVILSQLNLPSAPTLTVAETRYLSEKLYNGYFAFEVLTERNWNSAICGICGVCPLFESGDGNAKNCTPLSDEMVTDITFLRKHNLLYMHMHTCTQIHPWLDTMATARGNEHHIWRG